MADRVLSGFQALQLLALGPSIFIIFFLCLTARKPTQVVVPVLFFLSLSCSFCLPLLEAFPENATLKEALLLGEALTPALIFLLVVQFTTGRIPSPVFWTILAVPLIGGGALVHAAMMGDALTCVRGDICLHPAEFKQLYGVFSAALTFLLTVLVFHRVERAASPSPQLEKTINALVFALIVLNLLLLALQLLTLKGEVTPERSDICVTVVRIGFIYLVLTSIFRVFDRSVEIAFDRVPTLAPAVPTEREKELALKLRTALAKDKLYRTMDISREKLAKNLAVTEHALSRAVNLCCAQSISTLVNQYRVEEAKERLAKEETAITTIAFEVGFNSIPSFNRVFKQVTGVSPSAYRATQHKAPV